MMNARSKMNDAVNTPQCPFPACDGPNFANGDFIFQTAQLSRGFADGPPMRGQFGCQVTPDETMRTCHENYGTVICHQTSDSA
jgi:hypothetical protein